MAKRKQPRLYRLARIWLRRNPFKGLLIVGLITFCLGLGLYEFLNQYDWGKIVITLIFTMITSEGSMASMVANGKPFWIVVSFVLVADSLNILLDLYVVNHLLAWKFFRTKIDWLNRQLKRLFIRVKKAWLKVIVFLPWIKSVSTWPANGFSNPFDYVQDRINGIKHNPSKAGYGAIAFLGLMPRVPFFIIGGVSVAVFIIRFKKYGLKAWLIMFGAIIVRTAIWLGSLYGLFSIF